jgi:hypothetical protein
VSIYSSLVPQWCIDVILQFTIKFNGLSLDDEISILFSKRYQQEYNLNIWQTVISLKDLVELKVSLHNVLDCACEFTKFSRFLKFHDYPSNFAHNTLKKFLCKDESIKDNQTIDLYSTTMRI